MAQKAPTLMRRRGVSQTLEMRGSARKRGYDRAWEKLSIAWRNEHPLCAMCIREGRDTAGVLVDHIVPLKVDPSRRLDRTNLQTLCRHHHQIKTAAGL